MKQVRLFFIIILAFLLSLSLTFINTKKNDTYNLAYKVYIDGKDIGYIKDKKDLENYISNLKISDNVKEKYKVNKVYLPSNVNLEEIYVKDVEYKSPEEVYKQIEESNAKLTVKGYEVTIGSVEYQTLEVREKIKETKFYVLDKKVLNDGINNFIKTFISNEEYEFYFKNNKFIKLDKDTNINKIKLLNTITIKETNVSTDKNIFTDAQELSRYLLFGNNSEKKEYIVKEGESIAKIAEKSKISIKEFLMVNPDIKSENELLYPGQKVNVSLINPSLIVEKEITKTSLFENKYEDIVQYDQSKGQNYKEVKQEGENGLAKTTYKYRYFNDKVGSVSKVSIETIKPSKSKITVLGSRYVSKMGDIGIWSWPTVQPYHISSYHGWRTLFGQSNYHEGIDITVPGSSGTPIYAANNGVVVSTADGYPANYHNCYGKGMTGNHVYINHNNGYYTTYLHMRPGILVQEGQTVVRGQLIGYMGNSGCSFGEHLHFGLTTVKPYTQGYASGGNTNPLVLFRR